MQLNMGILVAKKVDEQTDETLTWLSCLSIPYLGCSSNVLQMQILLALVMYTKQSSFGTKTNPLNLHFLVVHSTTVVLCSPFANKIRKSMSFFNTQMSTWFYIENN